MVDPKPIPPTTVWERHLQTLMMFVLLSLLGWVGYTLNQLQLKVTQIEGQISAQIRIEAEHIDALEARVGRLENAVWPTP